MAERAAAAIALIFLAACGGSRDAPAPGGLEETAIALRDQAARPAASPAELLDRLGALWDLANALALEGVAIPVDYPLQARVAFLAVSKIAAGASPADAAVLSTANTLVDRTARELSAKAGDPAALGVLALSEPGPFRAGQRVTLAQTYTVGEVPMRVGGGVVLTSGRGAQLQTADPAAEGFVSVATSRAGARLVPNAPWGEWTSFIHREVVAFRLEGQELRRGDVVTITYGDGAGGSPGVRLQAWSNDQVTFPVRVDLEGKGEAWTLQLPAVEVRGAAEIAYVNAIVPSVAAPGEPFDLAVRSEDGSKNLASASTPAYRVLADGEPLRTIPAGSGALTVIEDLVLDRPGVYRFEVRSEDGRLSGRSNPLWVREGDGDRVLWGETHGHSGFAEGQGSPDGYYRFGRDVARLDFLSLSEHDLWMDDAEWEALRAAVGRYRDPGRFTPFLGYEWTASNPDGGHHNVFFAEPDGRRRVPVQETVRLEDLYRGLAAENSPDDVLVIPHAHQSGDWEQSDPSIERLVEIQSGHGTFEYFGNRYLARGWQVGFVGASDNHFGHPGYSGIRNRQLGGLAAVLAPRNDARTIFGALRDRAVYATTGERILLDARLNGQRMGLRLPDADERRVEVRVHGTAPIDAVDLVKNGTVAYTRRFLETRLGAHPRVQVKLESSTEVFTGRKNPRVARSWRGSIEVEGASLVGFEPPWFANPATFRLERAAGSPNRLELQTNTRGRGQAILLDLDDATRAATVIVRWAEAAEEAAGDGTTREMMDRDLATLPPGEARFRLGDLVAGPVRREVGIGQDTDRVSAQLVPDRAPLDQVFEFVDRGETRSGDYYYVRVTQVDGAMAWSSPWWVGAPAAARQ
jgi:hypothetical protein